MEKVYLLGGGGLGREIISWNEAAGRPQFSIAGCFDENPLDWSGFGIEDVPVLGNDDDAMRYDHFVVGVMDVNIKEKLYERFSREGKSFVSFQYPNVIVGSRSVVGPGATLMPGVLISCDVKIGNLVTINVGSQIGHDCRIGDYCSLMSSVNLGGGVTLGDKVFIGTGAVLLPRITIAPKVRIGAGSVVIKSIKEEGTYFGNPAKRVF